MIRIVSTSFCESYFTLSLLEVVGLFVGKAIQVVQLQNILNSRFVQLALLRSAEKDVGSTLASAVQNPDQLARIVAKSFYKELTRAGFGSGQIINTASEIIEQLSGSLNRHSKRRERKNADDNVVDCGKSVRWFVLKKSLACVLFLSLNWGSVSATMLLH